MGDTAHLDVAVRLDKSTVGALDVAAHGAGITMNTLLNRILEITLADWRRAAPGSRNAREGRYVGRYGCHLRSHDPRYSVGMPVASLARALMRARPTAPGMRTQVADSRAIFAPDGNAQ